MNSPSDKCSRGSWRQCLAGWGVIMSPKNFRLCGEGRHHLCGEGSLLTPPGLLQWGQGHLGMSTAGTGVSGVIITSREDGNQVVRVVALVSSTPGTLSDEGHDPSQSVCNTVHLGEIPPSADSHCHTQAWPAAHGNRPATTVPTRHSRTHHPRQ